MKAFTHMRLRFKPEMVTREKQLFFSLDDQLTFTHAHTFAAVLKALIGVASIKLAAKP